MRFYHYYSFQKYCCWSDSFFAPFCLSPFPLWNCFLYVLLLLMSACESYCKSMCEKVSESVVMQLHKKYIGRSLRWGWTGWTASLYHITVTTTFVNSQLQVLILSVFLKWQPCHFPVMAICFVVFEFTYSFHNVFQELGQLSCP